MRKVYFVISAFILLGIAGIALYLTALPAFLNSDFFQNKFSDEILKNTNFDLNLSDYNVKTSVFPLNLRFTAQEISLKNNLTDEFIKIKDFNSNIRLSAIFTGTLYVKNTSFNSAEVYLNKDYTEILTSSEFMKKIKHVKVKNFTFNQIKADISGQKYLGDTEFNLNKTQISEFNLKRRIALATDLSLTHDGATGLISLNSDIKLPLSYKNAVKSSLNANVENLNLEIIAKGLNKFFPEVTGSEGIINAQVEKNNSSANLNIIADGLKINFNDKPSILNTKSITIKSSLILSDKKAYLQSFKLVSNLIKTSVFGEIDLSDKKNIKNKLTVAIDKSNLAEFINLLPPLKDQIEEFDLCALKNNLVSGSIIGHLNIEGDILEPDIRGNISVSDLYLVKPIKNAKKASVKLRFTGKNMNMDTNVPTAPKEYVSAKGRFELYGEKRSFLTVKSTENVNLETAQVVLNPLQDIIKLYFGPVPVMGIKGFGNIDINVSGTRKEPNINGIFKFKNGEAYFNDIKDIVVKNMTGKLVFNDTDTIFSTESANLNSIPVNIKGNCDLFGKFDFNAETKTQNLSSLFNEIKTSPMLGDMQIYFDNLENVKGLGDVKLHIYGNLTNVHDMALNKNTFIDTDINLYSAGAKIKDLPFELSNVFGSLSLNKSDLLLDLYALINKSKVYINGKLKDDNANISINAKSFRLIDLTVLLPQKFQRPILTLINSENFIDFLPSIYTDFNAKYAGGIENINYNNLNLSGRLVSQDKKFKDVAYTLARSNFKFTPLAFDVDGINLNTSGTVLNLFSPSRSISGIFNLKDFNLEKINLDALKELDFIKPYIENIDKIEGVINVNSQIHGNNLNGACNLNNLAIFSGKNKLHEILSGKIIFRNNNLIADRINSRIYEMPVLLDGNMRFLNYKPVNYNFKVKAKPIQEFLDETFNKNAIYPIKLKGNISLDTEIKGTSHKSDIKSNLLLDKEASIYYLGATLGDKSDAVKINSDLTLNQNEIKINNINYNKIIPSLGEKENTVPLLTINGAINTLKDNSVKFNNLKIKSLLPVDAKIFNIIFRKPFVKEGVFTSDLILNGTSIKPEIIGKLDVTSVELPFFESSVNSINMNFTPKYLYISSKGDVVTNKINVEAKVKNDFTLPYMVEDISIHLDELNLNPILNKFKTIEETNFKIHNEISTAQTPDYTNFIVNSSSLTADKITIDKIVAQNFTGNVVIDRGRTLDVENFKFNMSDGSVDGSITHNYDTNKLSLNLNLNKADAANIAETLFNLKGQIYGLANGKINLTCNSENDKICMETLSGDGYFEIQNGRMPKLGSLEYLLKAGNLINGGLSGLTINGIIDLLSPLKSGEFNNINGNFVLNNGIAENINIYSDGKDLNMYISGNYDISTAIADFKIFGSLSKNVTTPVNKVKNLSLNTLLKKIPIAKREKDNEFTSSIAKIPSSGNAGNIYKFFRVLINGDINESGFVKSFEWID